MNRLCVLSIRIEHRMKERFYFSRQYIHIMFSLCSCIVCRSSVDVRHSAVQQGLCFTAY